MTQKFCLSIIGGFYCVKNYDLGSALLFCCGAFSLKGNASEVLQVFIKSYGSR